MSTNVCCEQTRDGFLFYPGGVKDSHPFNTAETGVKRRLHQPPVRIMLPRSSTQLEVSRSVTL